MSYIPNINGLEDLRLQVDKEPTHIKINDLADKYSTSITSLEDFVNLLVTKNALYTHNDAGDLFFTYSSDIRFNYRDKYIFIPFTTYSNDIKTEVKQETYDNSLLRKYEEVYTNIRGEKVTHYYLYPKYFIGTYNKLIKEDSDISFLLDGIHYIISITGLPLTTNLVRSLDKCTKLYYNLHYHAKGDYLRYIEVDGRIAVTERTLRKRLELPKYTVYSKLHYGDIRYYTHSEMEQYIIKEDKSFNLRVLEFEMYLYILCNTQGVTVEDKYTKDFNKLGVTTRFLNIGEHHPLILKWYYIDPLKFKRKSYENFKIVENK